MRSDMRFATFIDDTLREYATSLSFRAALHAEAPGAPAGVVGICPPEHRHASTGTCYSTHGCRCPSCRLAASKRQKRDRMRRAAAEWNRINREKAS